MAKDMEVQSTHPWHSQAALGRFWKSRFPMALEGIIRAQAQGASVQQALV